MKFLILMSILISSSCATALNAEPDNAGTIIRKIAKPGKMGNGTHDGRGRPNDRRERKAMENKQKRRSPPGGDARNSSTRT